MGDEIDRAQEINETLQQDALQRHFRRGIHNAMYASEFTCSDCDEEIPQARRTAAPGCTRCLSCQRKHEQAELLTHWRPM